MHFSIVLYSVLIPIQYLEISPLLELYEVRSYQSYSDRCHHGLRQMFFSNLHDSVVLSVGFDGKSRKMGAA